MKCRGKSLALERALTGFGAEKSFQRASEQLKEHYGGDLHRSSIREVTLKHAERAAGFVEREGWGPLTVTRTSGASGMGNHG